MGDGFEELADQLSSMMDDMRSKSAFRYSRNENWAPAINLYELPDRFVVCVELAGMRHDAIEIHAGGNRLTIKGHRPKPPLPDGAPESVVFHLLEINSGGFERRIQLPDVVDADRVSASYKHGYVWIEMPRKSGGQS
jgi:HSP20 family protein